MQAAEGQNAKRSRQLAMHIDTAPTDFRGWEELLQLLQRSFAGMEGRIDPPSSLQGMTPQDLASKAQRETLLLARDGQALLGCAFADQRPDALYLGKVAVDAKARRQGVARALVEAAARCARDRGLLHLELQTRIELIENHQTFAALGFQKVAETAHPGYTRPTSITMRRSV